MPPPGVRRRVVGYAAGAVGMLALLASALWWHGEARWGRYEALSPERAFADGTLGLELAPLKYILVASKLRPSVPSANARSGESAS